MNSVSKGQTILISTGMTGVSVIGAIVGLSNPVSFTMATYDMLSAEDEGAYVTFIEYV